VTCYNNVESHNKYVAKNNIHALFVVSVMKWCGWQLQSYADHDAKTSSAMPCPFILECSNCSQL